MFYLCEQYGGLGLLNVGGTCEVRLQDFVTDYAEISKRLQFDYGSITYSAYTALFGAWGVG